MSVKVVNSNIFASLQDDSDNEAPVVVASKKAPAASKGVDAPKQAAQTQAGEKAPRGAGRGERRHNNAEGEARQTKEHHKPRDSRDNQKPKELSSQPHPYDRKSGTGTPAYGSRFRKDGGGRGNYGTIKNEVQDLNQGQTAPATKVEEVPVVVEVPEEPVVVDNTITVDEYFRRLGVTGEEAVKEAPKRELNHDELKRDKLQVVVSKNEKTLDVNIVKAQKKRNQANPTYLLGCNTENSELLGVKTG